MTRTRSRCEVRLATRQLLIDGHDTGIGGRAFDVLLTLIEQRPEVVGKAELYRRVWSGLAVEPNNLQVQVWALRRLIGARAIGTVPRRGYQFTPVLLESDSQGYAFLSAPDVDEPADILDPQAGPDEQALLASQHPALPELIRRLQRHPRLVLVARRIDDARQLVTRAIPVLADRFAGGAWQVEARDWPWPTQGAPLQEPPGRAAAFSRLLQRLDRHHGVLVVHEAHRLPPAAMDWLAGVAGESGGLRLVMTARESLSASGLEELRVDATLTRMATGTGAGLR